jgi:hypothetical protein
MQLNDFWESRHLVTMVCLETHILIGFLFLLYLHTFYLLYLFGAIRLQLVSAYYEAHFIMMQFITFYTTSTSIYCNYAIVSLY